MRLLIIAILLLTTTSCDDSGPDVAPELVNKVASGQLRASEVVAAWVWGDGVNNLCQGWSSPGRFYGTEDGYSSADVAVIAQSDPLSINNAESLTYVKDFVHAQPGQTVVFRGRNGYFGAWSIEEITAGGMLYGTWYFRSGGGGDFTAELAEEGVPAIRTAANCDNY